MKKNTNYLLPLSIIALVGLYAFVYQPKPKKEKYCGACGK